MRSPVSRLCIHLFFKIHLFFITPVIIIIRACCLVEFVVVIFVLSHHSVKRLPDGPVTGCDRLEEGTETDLRLILQKIVGSTEPRKKGLFRSWYE